MSGFGLICLNEVPWPSTGVVGVGVDVGVGSGVGVGVDVGAGVGVEVGVGVAVGAKVGVAGALPPQADNANTADAANPVNANLTFDIVSDLPN